MELNDWQKDLFERITGLPLVTVPIGGRTIALEQGLKAEVEEWEDIVRICHNEREYLAYLWAFNEAISQAAQKVGEDAHLPCRDSAEIIHAIRLLKKPV